MPNAPRRRLPPLGLAALAMASGGWAQSSGSAVCASCHAAIYESYRATTMARSARKADAASIGERFDRASFAHAGSGYRYRVSIRSSAYILEFDNGSGGVRGEKPLAYAIGSGTRAVSYLMADDGFLYEAPVAYYASTQAWGLEPGYGQYSYPYLTRPIAPGCLSCHASLLQAERWTLNRYRSPAFLEGGVSCARCHGDGGRHIVKMKSGDWAGDPGILNPAKLAPASRDSICAQCHLTGDVRVMHAGADWQSFQPGDRLSDSQTVFVRARKAGAMTVTGHVESLASSGCKRASGERLWCGSCHDPHFVPRPAEAGAWYRSKCLTCHSTNACSARQADRARANDDCIGCHMPKRAAADAQHVVMTDHSIPRQPHLTGLVAAADSDAELMPFGGGQASGRDLAMAYAIAAIGKAAGADRTRARSLLETVVKENPNDSEVMVSLAEIHRNDGRNDLALPLYERAIAIDPGQVTARVGLGGVMMERGEFAKAVRLWNDALAKNAGLELVRLNLSIALLNLGQRAAAEANLRKALNLNPAFAPARELLARIGQRK